YLNANICVTERPREMPGGPRPPKGDWPPMRPPYPMPSERQTALFLNGRELLRIQTTPVDLEDWVLGFLYSESLIDAPADLRAVRVDLAIPAVYAAIDPARMPEACRVAARYQRSRPGRVVAVDADAHR